MNPQNSFNSYQPLANLASSIISVAFSTAFISLSLSHRDTTMVQNKKRDREKSPYPVSKRSKVSN